MTQIQLQDDLKDISIKIIVNTAANWEYDYLHKGNHYAYDISLPPKPFPHEFTLGNTNLGEIDSWEFRLTNPLSINTAYSISIEWWQNGVQINTWNNSGNIISGTKVTPNPSDDAQYYI